MDENQNNDLNKQAPEGVTAADENQNGHKKKLKKKITIAVVSSVMGIITFILLDGPNIVRNIFNTFTPPEQPIEWYDKKFEKMIRHATNRPIGVILPSELEDIESLYIYGDSEALVDTVQDSYTAEDNGYSFDNGMPKTSYGDIKSLSDIKYFPNLKKLLIVYNKIEAVDFNQLPQELTWLVLSYNKISNLTGDKQDNKIDYLVLRNNNISDISSLENLSELQTLYIQNNNISDISAIQNMYALQLLDIWGNYIIDISPIKQCTYLTYVDAGRNYIYSIDSLSNLENIEELYLFNNEIKDISAIRSLKKLIYIDLGDNKIRDIAALSELSSLRKIWLGWNAISDLKPLEAIAPSLLSLKYNFISDLTPLKNYPSESEIYLDNNLVVDWEPVKHITSVGGRPDESAGAK